ncbi:hypothetical protein J1605_006407 [Eschrichtius robustus]|uniref:Urocanase C-terminal domain-containing protein n=1 Tax=Eschrichtius robustus TaxID=9764 RepID=A0AB34H4R8_ESCRO|nr:hypothetical protein J1605_006407 [Eschrichtius robustus]
MVRDLCTGVSKDTRRIISMVPPMRQLHPECDSAWGSQQTHPQSPVKEPGQVRPLTRRGTPPVNMNRFVWATGSAGSPLAGTGPPAAGTRAQAQEFRFRSLGGMGQRVLTLLVGTGGEVINGGFGLVLDGTQEAEQKAKMVLSWDVSNGVARRCWSGNPKAYEIICQTMQEDGGLVVTLPHEAADERVLQRALRL